MKSGLLLSFALLLFLICGIDNTQAEDKEFHPRPIKLAELQYPERALAAGASGDVLMQIRINRAGKVESAKGIVCTAPNLGFEKEAKRVIMKSTFMPLYLYGDRPNATQTGTYTVKFRCYDGLLATPGTDLGEKPLETVSDSLADLVHQLKTTDWSFPGKVTLYPRDSSIAQPKTADFWFAFTQTTDGSVDHAWQVCANSDDTSLSRIALSVVQDGLFMTERPWTTKPDTLYTRVAFRGKKPGWILREKELDEYPGLTQPKQVETAIDGFTQAVKNESLFQARLQVEALVEKDGSVKLATISESSGYRKIDSICVFNAYFCKYEPARFQDNPIPLWVTYELECNR